MLEGHSRARRVACLAAVATVFMVPFFLPAPQTGGVNTVIACPDVIHASDLGNGPGLSNGSLDTLMGHANSTTFTFRITYTCPSNASPAHVNVTLLHESGVVEYQMDKINASAGNFTAGIVYARSMVFTTSGQYSYFFHASNGSATARYPATGMIAGPSVLVPRNYTIVPFQWFNATGGSGVNQYQPTTFTLPFKVTLFGQSYSQLQTTFFGFARFIQDTNNQPLVIPSTEARSRLAFLFWSQRVYDVVSYYNLDISVKNEGSRFLMEQNVNLTDWHDPYTSFNMSYQFVLYPNSTALINIKHAIFTNFTMNETIGFNHGNGFANMPFTYATNITNTSLLFDFSPINQTRIGEFDRTPETGDQNTMFTFSLSYWNLENVLPHQVRVRIDGVNHTMAQVNASDTNVVDGKRYAVQVGSVNPSTVSTYSFHVLGPDGWQQSDTFTVNTTWTAAPAYHAGKLAYLEQYSFASGFTVVSSEITTIPLPFSFPFYGHEYTSLVLSRQGFIRFTSSMNTSRPVVGGKDDASMLSIALFNESITLDSVPLWLPAYKVFPGTFVLDFLKMRHDGQELGDFQLIIKANGDIVFTFFRLTKNIPGGVNLGDGLEFTRLPLDPEAVPLNNTSFLFTPYKNNTGAILSSSVNGTLFTTADLVGVSLDYTSPNNVTLSEVWYTMEGIDVHGSPLLAVNESLDLIISYQLDFSSGVSFSKSFLLASGNYTFQFHVKDFFGNIFVLDPHVFVVNDPPAFTVRTQLPTHAGAGDNLTIQVDYHDPEGVAPSLFLLVWNGTGYPMTASSTNFSSVVRFSYSMVLVRGVHVFSVMFKDPFQPSTVFAIHDQSITVYLKPEIDILEMPGEVQYMPGTHRVRVRLTSPEGHPFLAMYASINGILNITFQRDHEGGSNDYFVDVPLHDGENTIAIIVSDGFNSVRWPAGAGEAHVITVINLPLVLCIVSGSVAGVIAIVLFRKRSKEASMREKEEIKRRIKSRRHKALSEEEIEEKRLEKLKELQDVDAVDAIVQPVSPVKKSAAFKKATVASAGSSGGAEHVKTAKASGGGGGTSPGRDKSRFAPKADDSSSILNKTILKEYMARMTREGTTSLHYIKIKNDLNVISKKKSSKLYKLLQELVEKGLLVRKGSTYVIVT